MPVCGFNNLRFNIHQFRMSCGKVDLFFGDGGADVTGDIQIVAVGFYLFH